MKYASTPRLTEPNDWKNGGKDDNIDLLLGTKYSKKRIWQLDQNACDEE